MEAAVANNSLHDIGVKVLCSVAQVVLKVLFRGDTIFMRCHDGSSAAQLQISEHDNHALDRLPISTPNVAVCFDNQTQISECPWLLVHERY